MDMRLELVPLPSADVDRSKAFYIDQVGFILDHDVEPGNGMRTFGLPRNPSVRPSSDTADATPRSSAARMPEAASVSLNPAAQTSDGCSATTAPAPAMEIRPDVNFRRCMRVLR